MIDFIVDVVGEPKTYRRNNKDCYLDPISKALRIRTSEETVRQKLLKYLHNNLLIPMEAISVEEAMAHHKKGARGRADIIIYAVTDNFVKKPIAVIECKAPEVFIVDMTYKQVETYANILDVNIIGVTNGLGLVMKYRKPGTKEYMKLEELPKYDEMCKPEQLRTIPTRQPEQKSLTLDYFNSIEMYDWAVMYYYVGIDTPKPYIPIIHNLINCFLLKTEKCKELNVYGYELIEDLGVRMTTFGNASGFSYTSNYRSLMFRDMSGDTQIISFTTTENGQRTYLMVAIDNYETHHHSLQLQLDKNMKIAGNQVEIKHDGRIAIGKNGSASPKELIRHILKNGTLELCTDNKSVYLGTLGINHVFSVNSPDIKRFLENLITYAFLRDEFREYYKQNKSK